MSVEFDSKVTDKELLRFKLIHNYKSVGGVAGILCGIVLVVLSVLSVGKTTVSYTLMTGTFGIIFLIYPPMSIYLKVKRQMKEIKAFSDPVHYCVTEKNIMLSQGDVTEELLWESVFKIVLSKNVIIIYLSTIQANIIPIKDLGDKAIDFVDIANKKLKPFQVKVDKEKLKRVMENV